MLAAIRLEDYGDKIEDTLLVALAEPSKGAKSSNLQDPLATSKWEKVSWKLCKFVHELCECKLCSFCSSIELLV